MKSSIKTSKAYLGVGSNLGEREVYLKKARRLISKLPRTKFLRSSSIYETDPVGGPPQGKYLNAVWEIETSLPPGKLKEEMKSIEKKLGRRAADPNAPRKIDLDLLFYGRKIVREPALKIPHPRLHERPFVLEPLCELVPGKRHPVLKKTMREFRNRLRKKNRK